MTELRATYRLQLGGGFGFPGFYTWLVLRALEAWSGFTLAEVRLLESYRALPRGLPVWFIGAGLDRRTPPQVVEEAFGAVPGDAPAKELWIAPDTHHGRVWVERPAEYRERLRRFVERALGD